MSKIKINETTAAIIIGFLAISYAMFGEDVLGIRVIILLLGCLFGWLAFFKIL